jgi:hypothetical protein
MSIPTERLRSIINERILAEWVDTDTSTTCTLGSCSLVNKQAPKFFMKVDADTESGLVHIHFSLIASVKAAGRTRRRELLLILPQHAFQKDPDFALAFASLETSNIGDSSLLDPSTIKEAGLIESGYIVRVRFNLDTNGLVVMPKTTAETIKPSTTTSGDLLLGLKSLSNVLSFTVYMRRSDYALHGLKTLHEHLRNSGTSPYYADLAGMYDGRGAILVDWNKLEYKGRRRNELPPPYCEEPKTPSATVQIPQSSPITADKDMSLCTEEPRVTETPTGTPIRDPILPSPVSVLHGIFSDAVADPESIGEELELIEQGLEDFGADSDEEYYAMLNARELSPPPADSTNPEALLSEVIEWLNGAMTINGDVHKHRRLRSKLSALGQYARMSNITALDKTRMWCSALLFYDPGDSDNTPELWDPAIRWLVSDIADLVLWANDYHRCAEMCSPVIRSEFVRLGSAARALALQPKHDSDAIKYKRQKSVCIARVLFEFGAASAGIGGEDRLGGHGLPFQLP